MKHPCTASWVCMRTEVHNGVTKQSSDVNKLIWNVRDIIADLSLFYHLTSGDLI